MIRTELPRLPFGQPDKTHHGTRSRYRARDLSSKVKAAVVSQQAER